MGIGSHSKGSLRIIRDAAELTTSYVVSDTVDIRDFGSVAIVHQYTQGSLTSTQVKVEFTDADETFWVQDTDASSISGGQSTNVLVEQHYAGVSAAYLVAQYSVGPWSKMRVSVKGTGTVSSSSSVLYMCGGSL